MRDLEGKLVSFVLGGALAAVFAWFGLEALRDYRTFDDAPARSTLLAAVDASSNGRRWVSIDGAPWRCERLLENVNGGAAFVPARAEDGSIVVARFDHPIRCEAVVEAPLVGILSPMSAQRESDLRAAGLAIDSGARLRTFDVCAFCGKSNARLGVIICGFFVLVGLGLYPLRLAYQSMRGGVVASLRAAIHAPRGRTAEAERTVRIYGAAVLLAAAVALAMGEGWVIYGVIPVRWFGVLGAILGGWMIAFPASYRAVASRSRK